jgi:hypothetical protein
MKNIASILITLGLFIALSSTAYADPTECRKYGSGIRECSMANQNGYSCKAWKCFKRCMRTKGFSGSCYDKPAKLQECTQANDTCESQCKYK